MKKSLIVATLAVLLSVNVLTPITYATGDLSENGSGMSENGSDNFGDLEGNSDSNSDGDGNGSDDVGNPAGDQGDDSSQQGGDDLTGDDITGSDNNQRDDQSSTDDAEILPGEGEGDVDPQDPVALPLAQPMPAMAPAPLGNTAPFGNTAPSPVQDVTLVDGQTFNSILETLAGDLSNITAIAKGTESDMQAATITGDISATGDGSIVAWYDDGTLYYYTSGNVVMNSDSSAMFKNCSNLTDISVLSTWNTSNVISLYDFFNGCSSLSDFSSVENWDVSNVTDMRSIFYGVGAEDLDLSNWNTSSATQMNNMFQESRNLKNLNLSNWNTSSVTSMRYMFAQCVKLEELNLSSFDTSKVTDMTAMFFIGGEDTTKLKTIYVSDKFVVHEGTKTDMMFKRQVNLVGQNGSQCSGTCEGDDTNGSQALIDNEYMTGYFTVAPEYVSIVLNYDRNNPSGKVEVHTITKGETFIEPNHDDKAGYTFDGWYNSATNEPFDFSVSINENISLYAKYTSDAQYATFLKGEDFKSKMQSLANGDVSNIKHIVRSNRLDRSAKDLLSTADSVPVYAWYKDGTVYYYSEVGEIYLNNNCSNMFYGYTNLISVDTSGRDTSNVTNMLQMFRGCENLEEIDVSTWDTSKVTNMQMVFHTNKSLKSIDLSNWDTAKVINMKWMFKNTCNLVTIFVSDTFVTSSADGTNMFEYDSTCGSKIKLIGGNNTAWTSSKMSKAYAKIDNLSQSGYFTDATWPRITFDTMGGMELAPRGAMEGYTLVKPTDPTKSNLKLVGRYKESSLENERDFNNDTVQESMTLYAKWGCNEGYELNKDATFCLLTVAEDQRRAQQYEDLELFFVGYDGISVHYTIMDRNMGASVPGTGSDSFGYYYQRGNNYGFTKDNDHYTRHSPLVPYREWSVGIPSKYASGVFIATETTQNGQTQSQGRQGGENDQLTNNNLWGGGGDTEYSNGGGSKIDRQGPCPDGYYVPSVSDWSYIYTSWTFANLPYSSYKKYASDILLPLAGEINSVSAMHSNDGKGYYRSSSSDTTKNAYRMMMRGNGYNDFKATSKDRRGIGESVRCFKNNFVNEGVPYKLTVYPNGGNTAVITISQDVILTLDTPTHPDRLDFLGRYTTPNFLRGTKVEVGSGVSDATGLYARWEGDEESFVVSFVDEDGTELQKSEVTSGYMPEYDGETPSKNENMQYTYTFAGWIPSLETVIGDATYTATYTPILRQYTVKFVDEDGTELSSTKYDYGTKAEDITKPADPTKADDKNFKYTFAGWSSEIVDVVGDATYTATYDSKKKGGSRSGGGKGGNADSGTHGSADDNPSSGANVNDIDGDVQDSSAETLEGQGELFDVHRWAYENGLTRYANINDARMNDPLNRAEMAKISSIFDTNFLGRTPYESKKYECSAYPDIQNMTGDLYHFVVQSCELGNMGYHYDNEKYIPKFMPYEPVSIVQASVILSRLAWGKKYIIGPEMWYQGHMYAVYDNALLDNISNPLFYITRREAFTAFYRLDKMLKDNK